MRWLQREEEYRKRRTEQAYEDQLRAHEPDPFEDLGTEEHTRMLLEVAEKGTERAASRPSTA